ncbi:MAG: hypothetical protein ACXIUZ_00690 [Lysobacteraceae bacterium]
MRQVTNEVSDKDLEKVVGNLKSGLQAKREQRNAKPEVDQEQQARIQKAAARHGPMTLENLNQRVAIRRENRLAAEAERNGGRERSGRNQEQDRPDLYRAHTFGM